MIGLTNCFSPRPCKISRSATDCSSTSLMEWMDRNVPTPAEKSDPKGTLQDQKRREMSLIQCMWWRQTVVTVVVVYTQAQL